MGGLQVAFKGAKPNINFNSVGQLDGPFDSIEAEIQSKIGEFLILKRELLYLKNSDNYMISVKATQLYNTQVNLEVELNKILVKIEAAKAGKYDLADLVNLGDFVYRLSKHMNASKKLLNRGANASIKNTTGVVVLPIIGELTNTKAVIIASVLGLITTFIVLRKT